jgi:predicted transcriptional regulator
MSFSISYKKYLDTCYTRVQIDFLTLHTLAPKNSSPMEVITIQSEAFKEIMSKLDNIERKVQKISNRKKVLENEMIDTFEACRILKICRRTLERYR